MSVKDWADLNDNQIGPYLRELAEALESCDDPDKIRAVARRLKFMSGSCYTLAHYVEKKNGL